MKDSRGHISPKGAGEAAKAAQIYKEMQGPAESATDKEFHDWFEAGIAELRKQRAMRHPRPKKELSAANSVRFEHVEESRQRIRDIITQRSRATRQHGTRPPAFDGQSA